MTPQRYVLIVGLALIGIGIVLGLLIPVSVNGAHGSLTCGPPWTGSSTANEELSAASAFSGIYGGQKTDYPGLCTTARQTRGTIAIVLVGVGAVAVGGSFIRRTPAAVTTPSQPVVPSG